MAKASDSFIGLNCGHEVGVAATKSFTSQLIILYRLLELFDFQYTLECYVPAKKRKVGYFSLPLLYKAQFIGQIDLKVDRKTKILWVKNLVWEAAIKQPKKYMEVLKKALVEFAQFNDCNKIQSLETSLNRVEEMEV